MTERKPVAGNNKYIPGKDGKLHLRREYQELHINGPIEDARRRLTKLEGKVWDEDWDAAFESITKLQNQVDVLLLEVDLARKEQGNGAD